MRVAIYFTPAEDHPLTRAAAGWLGRDAFSGRRFAFEPAGGFGASEVMALTEAPRRYGFHATLKPPFWLAAGRTLEELAAATADFCRGMEPITVEAPRIAALGDFFAIVPGGDSGHLRNFAAEVVQHFDRFRAPPSAEEIERRRVDRLTAPQQAYLKRWGYPYVFDEFRFHMTLTGEVPEADAATAAAVLESRFAECLAEPLVVDSLALFVEPSPPGEFVIHRRVAFNTVREQAGAA